MRPNASESGTELVLVYDAWKQGIRVLAFFGIPSFFFIAYSIYAVAYSVDLAIPLAFFDLLIIIGLVLGAFRLYFGTKRIEFYEDYVRVFRKRKIAQRSTYLEIPYQQLELSHETNPKKPLRTVISSPEDPQHGIWKFYDSYLRAKETMLSSWVEYKNRKS